MKKYLLLILILAVSYDAQTLRMPAKSKSIAPKPCTLSKADKITLRGFYLGQDKGELSHIPFFEFAYKKALIEDKSELSKFGLIWLDKNQIQEEAARSGSSLAGYDDVDFGLRFIDGKVSAMIVTYFEYRPDNLNEFIQHVAETTSVRKEFWSKEDRHKASATCKGISMVINTMRYSGTESDPLLSSPLFSLYDDEADNLIQRRQNAELQKLKQQELVERRKRKIFKP